MKNPNFAAVRLALAVVAITLLVLTIALMPVSAQNVVPPTAQQARPGPSAPLVMQPAPLAPRSARRATPQAARKSLAPACALARTPRALPQDGVLYTNGPANLNEMAWTINFGYAVSDSVSLASAKTVTGFDFYVWEAPGDMALSVDWSFTSAEFGGTTYGSGTASVTDTFVSYNQYGYQIDYISVSGLNVSVPAGTSWLNLQNAVMQSGGALYWDQNSGPSQASENTIGSIPSEAFDVLGTGGGGPPPPPPTCYGSGGKFEIIHDFTQQEDAANVPSGVTMDEAGNLYGTTPSGGVNSAGLAYELSMKGQGWTLNPLYSFLGGASGSGPSGVILGPNNALYGTASGGSQNCRYDTQPCGLIFSLRPGPTACLTALCSWMESLLYQPSGSNDAYDPNNLVFDQAGNLYGISYWGGAYGQGAVFELTPSNGSWSEKILYSFSNGTDGANPNSLLLGHDGNLYGTTTLAAIRPATTRGGPAAVWFSSRPIRFRLDRNGSPYFPRPPGRWRGWGLGQLASWTARAISTA